MSETNWAALDAALCEKLGIAPELGDTFCECGHSHHTHHVVPPGSMTGACWRCPCKALAPVPRNKFYPKLSTTGGGMLVLIEALRKAGFAIEISINDIWRATVTTHGGMTVGDSLIVAKLLAKDERGWPAGRSVALAAAQALGIEVPHANSTI